MASDPVGYTSNNDDIPAHPGDLAHSKIFTNGIVTPHASFPRALRLRKPREALENLRKLEEKFPYSTGNTALLGPRSMSPVAWYLDRVLPLDQG